MARPAPTPSASRPAPHGLGGGVILHILHPALPPTSIKLGRGKSRPRAMPIGRRCLPLWRDWLWTPPGPPDVTSAIRFVGLGDLGLGGWEGRKCGGGPGLTGRQALGWIPSPNPPAELSLGSRSSCAAGSTPAAVLGGGGGGQEEVVSRGTGTCMATWATASGPSPYSGLPTLEPGWLIHVPGGLRCEERVTFMSLASNSLRSFQLLQ